MKKGIILILISSIVNSSEGKYKLTYFTIAANNYVTALPVTGFPKVFYSQLHPGITLSTGLTWKNAKKHNWGQSFKIGYFSHRYIQRSVVLYSEFGYRYKAGKRWGLNIAAGGGYLHMIPASQQFKQNSNGDWEVKKLKSRPQGMLSLSLGVDYKINEAGNRVFMRYQNILQTPFVPGYVELLPYNVLHIGASFPISQIIKSKKDEK